MHRFWRSLTPFFDAPGVEGQAAGAAGEAANNGDGTPNEPSLPPIEILPDDEPKPRGAAAAGDEEDDDVEDDDDKLSDGVKNDAAYWRNRTRRLQRKVASTRKVAEPVISQLRRLAARGEDPVAAFQRLTHRAQLADAIEAAAAENPEIARLLGRSGDARPHNRARANASDTDDADDFDPKSLPFDPETDDVHKWMAAQAAEGHSLKKMVKQLAQQLADFQGGLTASARKTADQAEFETWKTAAESAAKKLPAKIRVGDVTVNFRQTFLDNVYGALRYVKEHRTGHTVDQVIAHYLQEAKGGKTADAAARERMARNNGNLPQHQAGGGNAAPAKKSKETLGDISKRLFGVSLPRR